MEQSQSRQFLSSLVLPSFLPSSSSSSFSPNHLHSAHPPFSQTSFTTRSGKHPPPLPRRTFYSSLTPLPSSPWSRELRSLVHRGRATQTFAHSIASRSPARPDRLKAQTLLREMDPTLRSAQTTTSQTPAQTSTLPPSASTVDPSASRSNPLAQPSNPFTNPSGTISQTLTASIQSTSACAQEAVMSQTQPLSQALNDPSRRTGLPVASESGNAASVPRSETAPANQSAAAVYPHQVHGLGGPTATAPFLQDFNLVAEAAKRAQMSIVMRDLESVTL